MAVRLTPDQRSLHGHPEDGVTVAPDGIQPFVIPAKAVLRHSREGGNPAIPGRLSLCHQRRSRPRISASSHASVSLPSDKTLDSRLRGNDGR